jgi:hypothetical protein
MAYIIIWGICGFVGLGISASKKAGNSGVTGGDIVGAILLGPILMVIAIVMPHEVVYDQGKSDRLSAGDDNALDADHFKVLQHLAQHGKYNPERDSPIVWDKYRTKRVLTDLTALPQPLLNCAEGVYTLSEQGAETCHMAAFIQHLKSGGDPAQFGR